MSTVGRWADLRRFTSARVGLGRAGNALPTAAHLDFLEAHARARDAVHSSLDAGMLAAALAPELCVAVTSQAADRATYLLRPDLGRRLAPGTVLPAGPFELAFVVADGLAASGVHLHAPPLLARVLPALRARGVSIAPIVVARQARVAIGDPIGAAMATSAVVVLIGERPGLSAPESLGAYLTWAPCPGRTDAQRNCISNIRPDGLGYDAAAAKLAWLIGAMFAARVSGVALKDEQPGAASAPALAGLALPP